VLPPDDADASEIRGRHLSDTPLESQQEGIGCRSVGLTAIVLASIAAVLWAVGFILGRPDSCSGFCEWSSFTLMFAGTPVSALFTAVGGQDLVLAWPVDGLLWLVAAGVHGRLSQEADPWTSRWNRLTMMFVTLALLFGGFLALGVDRVR